MPDYTKTNFDEIETGRPGPVDGRMARKHLDSKELGVSRFRYEPNFQSPFGHRHGTQEEAYVVAEGSGRMRLDDEVIEIAQWDVIRVAPEVTRAFAAGPDGLTLICVGGERPRRATARWSRTSGPTRRASPPRCGGRGT